MFCRQLHEELIRQWAKEKAELDVPIPTADLVFPNPYANVALTPKQEQHFRNIKLEWKLANTDKYGKERRATKPKKPAQVYLLYSCIRMKELMLSKEVPQLTYHTFQLKSNKIWDEWRLMPEDLKAPYK